MHQPVLLHEAIEGLDLKEGDIVLDATIGNGGHAREFSRFLGKSGILIGIDQDKAALSAAQKNLRDVPPKIILEKGNFRDMDAILKRHSISRVDKCFFDLGLRSEQLEESGRGFSFRANEPLLMTFDSDPGPDMLTAYEIVNAWNEDELARILKEYGEERFARRIAKTIVATRKDKPIGQTTELVECVGRNVPGLYKRRRLHFATRTFQAIRIAVNDELRALEAGLGEAFSVLAPQGRIAVISFHSLEDRIVKNIFRARAHTKEYTLITKKPIIPSLEERTANPRSRSAKLRIISKQ